MSSVVTTFDPATNTAETFTAPQSAANGALVFFNESNMSLILSFADGSNMYLPAWYHRHKCGATGSVNVSWSVHTTLISGQVPTSEVLVEAFAQGEAFPADGPLVRQANGNVSTNVATVSAISNLGNAPGTNIITATPSDAASTWLADNSGNLTIQGDDAGVLTTLLQLVAGASPAVKIAAASVLTTILGNVEVVGNVNTDSGIYQSNGSTILSASGFDTFINARGVNNIIHIQKPLTGLSGNNIARWGYSSGTGSGTFNHNVGSTPDWVGLTCHVNGSQTMGYDSENSSQMHVTAGAGLAWKSLAFAQS